MPSQEVAVTAVFEANNYTVSFDAQGGETPNPASKSVTFASTYGTLATTSRTGYTFGGWWTGVGGAGSQVTSSTTMTTATNHTLYAKWTAHTYMVTYNGNGSTGGSTANSSHTYDVAKALTSNGFSRTGYTFAGWATSAGGALAHSNGESVLNLSATQGATVTLYAKWTFLTYAVTYDANGATSGTAPASQTKTHDVALTLATNSGSLLKTGYTFAGWNTAANGSGTNYAEGVSYAADEAIVLYAKWSASLSAVYRFWSPKFRGHFFTISESEKNNIIANLSQDWNYEGIAYYAFPAATTGMVPLYRFWSNRYNGHFFTISESEKNNIVANLSRDWSYEGIAYYVYPDAGAGGTPVYRFWSNRYKHHFFTISESEKNNIVANLSADWSYEGIAYYVPSVRAASPSGALSAVASAAFAGDADGAAASAEKVVAKAAALPAAATIGAASGTGDVLFPLSVPGGKVTAKISDMESGEDAEVLADADAPVAVSGVEAGRRYRLEISVEGPDGAASRIVHASSFEHRADEPDGLGDVDAAQAVAGTGVGNPVERIVAPAGDGRISLKLWSAAHGVVETREGVAGGDAVEFAIPDWNCWHWIGGWREPDDELVFSLWLRHELD